MRIIWEYYENDVRMIWKLYDTSEVPVEHETLKSGRDATGRRRWKNRREGWNIYVDLNGP